jgi:hypothetical protein
VARRRAVAIGARDKAVAVAVDAERASSDRRVTFPFWGSVANGYPSRGRSIGEGDRRGTCPRCSSHWPASWTLRNHPLPPQSSIYEARARLHECRDIRERYSSLLFARGLLRETLPILRLARSAGRRVNKGLRNGFVSSLSSRARRDKL